MEWEGIFKIRRHATMKWEQFRTCFGIFGLFTALGAKLPGDAALVARIETRLMMGGSVNIGGYEVKLVRAIW